MDGKLFQEWLREVDRNFEMQVRKIVMIRHFSHVTKSRIFKNLDLRKNADRNFRGTFLKNRFKHLKLYSNPPN